MPYFVYKIFPDKKLEPIDSLEAFRDARDLARSMRAAMPEGENCRVKVIFAGSNAEAEHLLNTPREKPILQEHEI